MLSLLGNRTWPIALDIGGDSVKMLQLQRGAGGLSVHASGRWRFPENASDPRQRRDMVVSAVRQMLRDGAFRGRRVVSALRCDELVIKNIRMPQMPDEKLLETICAEAPERLGFEAEPDQVNFLRAGQVRQGAEVRDEIILLAAEKRTIDEHVAMLEEMGLTAELIDAQPLAVFRSFQRFLRRKADDEAVTVLVDVGLTGTRVVVARGREIVFIKSIDLGGANLTEAVAKQFNLSFADAWDLRMRIMAAPSERVECGGDPNSLNWTLHDAIRAEVDSLAREIALCLRYCSVTFRGLRPEKVTLTGGEAYDPALVELLREHLDAEILVGQPLRGLDVSDVDLGADRRGVLTEWAVCAGLAARGERARKHLEEADHAQRRLSA